MIPDLHWAIILVGPLTIQVWGLFVALGIITAMLFAKREAVRRGLAANNIIDLTFWIILAAMLGSRLFFVFTELALFTNDWLGIFKVWDGGMSISGGFFGSVVAAYIFIKIKKLSFWEYADTIVLFLPLGLFIGRLGCFFIFDHPGSETTFFLGEEYYFDGLIRHNHGLYLSLNGLIMFGVFWLLNKKYAPKTPFFSILFLVWYGAIRLVLDFDRTLDSQFFSLTAAQFFGIGMMVLALVLFGQRQNIRKKLNLLKKS